MNETKHETKTANGPTKAPEAAKPVETAAPKAPKPALESSEAVRLMLTTLKRVAPADRPKVLATLAALA